MFLEPNLKHTCLDMFLSNCNIEQCKVSYYLLNILLYSTTKTDSVETGAILNQ